MNLIEVFALLTIVALTLCIGTCLRINRRKVMRAESMMRCLELAIRHEVALLPASAVISRPSARNLAVRDPSRRTGAKMVCYLAGRT